LALTSPTSSGRSVGIVRWRTKASDFVFVCLLIASELTLLRLLHLLSFHTTFAYFAAFVLYMSLKCGNAMGKDKRQIKIF
jgi:hypothetical protein